MSISSNLDIPQFSKYPIPMTRDELYVGQFLMNNSGLITQVIQIDYHTGLFTTRDPHDIAEMNWLWSINEVGAYFRKVASDTEFYRQLVKL